MALTVPVSEIVEKTNSPLLAKHESWGRVLLGDIASVQNGFAFKSSQFTTDEGMPLIRIRDVGEDGSDTFYKGEYDAEYVVQAGDLLVGMDGDFKCARWRGPNGLLNQRVCRIILQSEIYHPKLLDYALPGYLKAIHDVTSSVTVKHLSSKSIKEIPLPLPPFEVQTRIVAEIEKQFSRLDEAVANLKRVKANLKRYKAAVLKFAVEGKLTEEWRKQHPVIEPADKLLERILAERRKAAGKGKYKEPVGPDTSGLPELPAGWVWASADQLADKITDGEHLSPNTIDAGIPLLSAKDVRGFGVLFDDASFVSAEDAGRFRARCNPELGDILIVSRGATIGRSCIVNVVRLFCLMGSVILVKVQNQISSQFLLANLKATSSVKRLQGVSGSTAQQAIYIRDIRSLPVPLSSLAEQHQIVAEVERRLSIVAGAEAQVDADLRRADRLRQAILKQAFSGQLVPQGPNDEPASVLLERLRAKQPALTKEPAAHQRKHRTPSPKTGAPPPEPLPLVAEASATYGDAIIARILATMQPGHEYARADLVELLGLSTRQWNAAIQELKRVGKVRQVGERRAATYSVIH